MLRSTDSVVQHSSVSLPCINVLRVDVLVGSDTYTNKQHTLAK